MTYMTLKLLLIIDHVKVTYHNNVRECKRHYVFKFLSLNNSYLGSQGSIN